MIFQSADGYVYDQHFFELLEEPLGFINKSRIEFCLGENYFKRLELINPKF